MVPRPLRTLWICYGYAADVMCYGDPPLRSYATDVLWHPPPKFHKVSFISHHLSPPLRISPRPNII